MSFQPTLPVGGLAGWSLLTRTKTRQQDAFTSAPARKAEIMRFEQRFSKLGSAKALVQDRASLRVVLGAFGLQADLQNRAFIQRVIESGTEERGALANRLADKRYAALANAMAHLGPGGDGKPSADLIAKLTSDYQNRSFEIAVGEQDQSYRLAMTAEREIPAILSTFGSDRARWFGLIGNPPLRKVMETALGLPKEFGALPIDQQVSRLQAAARTRFNAATVEDLAKPETIGRVIQRFLIVSEMQTTPTRFSPALTLLSVGQSG
jgi:hypothetical protein